MEGWGHTLIIQGLWVSFLFQHSLDMSDAPSITLSRDPERDSLSFKVPHTNLQQGEVLTNITMSADLKKCPGRPCWLQWCCCGLKHFGTPPPELCSESWFYKPPKKTNVITCWSHLYHRWECTQVVFKTEMFHIHFGFSGVVFATHGIYQFLFSFMKPTLSIQVFMNCLLNFKNPFMNCLSSTMIE